MGTLYADDVRVRAALVVLSGETVRHAAEVFRASVAAAVTWRRRHRATGAAAARAIGGRGRDVMAAEEPLQRAVAEPMAALRQRDAQFPGGDVRGRRRERPDPARAAVAPRPAGPGIAPHPRQGPPPRDGSHPPPPPTRHAREDRETAPSTSQPAPFPADILNRNQHPMRIPPGFNQMARCFNIEGQILRSAGGGGPLRSGTRPSPPAAPGSLRRRHGPSAQGPHLRRRPARAQPSGRRGRDIRP